MKPLVWQLSIKIKPFTDELFGNSKHNISYLIDIFQSEFYTEMNILHLEIFREINRLHIELNKPQQQILALPIEYQLTRQIINEASEFIELQNEHIEK